MKAFTQRYPNNEYRKTYWVSSVHSTVVRKGRSSLGLISPTETIWAAINTQVKSHATTITLAIGGIRKT
jgi:hypothetical protein